MREAYEKSLQRDGHERDMAQEAVVADLEQLQQSLQSNIAGRGGFLSLFRA
jgi:predicted ATPase